MVNIETILMANLVVWMFIAFGCLVYLGATSSPKYKIMDLLYPYTIFTLMLPLIVTIVIGIIEWILQ